MNKKFRVEIKSVKISKFSSRETFCYQASVYVNGKRAFIASNDGSGGSDRYLSINKNVFDSFFDSVSQIDCESLIADLLGQYQKIKDMNRESKTKTMFKKLPGDDVYFSANAVGQQAIDYILSKYPNAEIYSTKGHKYIAMI